MNTRTPLITSTLLAASHISGTAHAALPSYKFTDFGISGAYGINASGLVVGHSNTTATLWNGTTATDLGTLGDSSVAYGTNQ